MKKFIFVVFSLFYGFARSGQNSSVHFVVTNETSYDGHQHRKSDCRDLCLVASTCSRLGGSVMSKCGQSDEVCCHCKVTQVDGDCRSGSKDLEAFWKSPAYPAPTVGTLLCQFVLDLQPGICKGGVRLDFLEFNTTRPLDRGLCHMDQLLILNSLDGPAFPRCGELSGYSTIVPVDPKEPLTLLSLVQSSSEMFRWNIRLVQIKCQVATKIQDYPGCGRRVNASSDNSSEKDTSVATEEGEVKEGKIEAPDNYFFIQYLKRAHEAVVEGSTNANNTLCKNSAMEIAAEKLKERIIRGQDALRHEFPWQVSIQDTKGHICGGAVISPRIILTAAHCFLSVSPLNLRNIRVVVGDLNLNSTTETTHTTMSLDSLLFHSHFDPYYLKNDIAVIRLRNEIPLKKGIVPVCLPEAGKSYAGSDSVISGWGAVNYPLGKLATHLQRVDNKVIGNDECKKRLKVDYIFSTMLCAVAPNCSGTCFGDSGGPLVVESSPGGKRQVVGIVSFGIGGCALLPYWPDVYTRVSEYLQWLSYATLPF